jgi:hypothetical protein
MSFIPRDVHPVKKAAQRKAEKKDKFLFVFDINEAPRNDQ